MCRSGALDCGRFPQLTTEEILSRTRQDVARRLFDLQPPRADISVPRPMSQIHCPYTSGPSVHKRAFHHLGKGMSICRQSSRRSSEVEQSAEALGVGN